MVLVYSSLTNFLCVVLSAGEAGEQVKYTMLQAQFVVLVRKFMAVYPGFDPRYLIHI